MNSPDHPDSSGYTVVAATDISLENTLLLDVRTPAEYEEAHIPGSVLHPLGNLSPEEVQQLATGKNHCVVICRSGNRARQAAEKLSAYSIPGLSVLQGGILAWEQANRSLQRGKKTISLERQVRIAAGSLVLLGAALGYFVHPAWIGLSGFVGAGLIFAGVTDTCGMGLIIARMPWNQRGG
jgi:rhodanese-related sulfurtransferase